MVALPKLAFYIQWLDPEADEWRFQLCNREFAPYLFFHTAMSAQEGVAKEHPGCVTRIVDQTGNVYGIPLIMIEAVSDGN